MSKLEKYLEEIQEAGWKKFPRGWDKGSVIKFAKSLAIDPTKKEFFDKCVKKMKGTMKDPEGFCASVKDIAHASTYWRGKGKTPKEVRKAVATHKRLKKYVK